MGVDSWAVDFGLLDARGRLVQNPVHYRDSRRPSSFQTVLSEIPARELYDRTGIQLIPINTIFELAAMVEERDPALGVAQQLLMIPDLVHYWLCGARATEFTNATTTQCLDAAERAWAVDLLERLDVPAHLPAELVGPGTILGPLAADVAERDGPARRSRDRARDARHGVCGRRRAVAETGLGLHQRRHLVARRARGRPPRDRRPHASPRTSRTRAASTAATGCSGT